MTDGEKIAWNDGYEAGFKVAVENKQSIIMQNVALGLLFVVSFCFTFYFVYTIIYEKL